jgi:hypothetical protein
MTDRNDEIIAAIVLEKELGSSLRAAIDRLRNYGLTLKNVHRAFASELGRTSASLADRQEFVRWMTDFARRAIVAYDLEMADLAERAAPRRRRARR